MHKLAIGAGILAVMFSGAIFGFFYAWVCSTMWGLDAADPRVAIAAMQAMNDSVRNIVFAPAFFGTPVVLLLAATLAFISRSKWSAAAFFTGALIYLLGGQALTMMVNVPMNLGLAELQVPEARSEAQRIWHEYSGPWQVWNQTRTAFSGVTLACSALGLVWLSMNFGKTRAFAG